DVEQRAVIGIDRGVADQDVDLAKVLGRTRDQRLDFLPPRDVAGNNVGIAACSTNSGGHFLAGLSLAAGNHHLGAESGQKLRRGTADAATGAGDNSYFACEIERRGLHGPASLLVRLCPLSIMVSRLREWPILASMVMPMPP